MPNGTMRADHLKRYQEFGDWLRGCYSVPIVSSNGSNATAKLKIPAGLPVDRVVIEEDLSAGELLRAYSVTVDGVSVANGSSIGHKRIALLNGVVTGKELIVTATGLTNAKLKRVSAYNCSRTP